MAAVDRNIVLIGFMGTGKSSVGKTLARKLGRSFVDVDMWIETSQKRKIKDIFETDGEAYFRTLEKEAIRIISRQTGSVITTGGGVVLDAENRRLLKETGVVIALLAKPETIYERVKNSQHRPLLQGADRLSEIQSLLESRKGFYQEADLFFETDGKTSAEVAENIMGALETQKNS